MVRMLFLAVVTLTMFAVVGVLAAFSTSRSASAQEVEFTAEYLSNPDNIALGKKVWFKRCKFCHAKTAYPGKGPKLQPSRYTPQFVYDRVTNGFRGMPSWKHEFSEDERKAVVAYVMRHAFSN
ncbi:MAG: c-type cytochrome [Acidiferrobacterales bacterium]